MAKTQKKATKKVAKKEMRKVTKRAPAKAAAKKVTKGRKTTGESARKADGLLIRAAAGAGRTLGRGARGVDRVVSAAKKSASALRRRGKAPAKPKIDPQEALERAKTRAFWKSQADNANAAQLAKHGAMVDERARVRSTMGMSWSNRKPR